MVAVTQISQSVLDYLQLTKPRIVVLLLFTTLSSYLVAVDIQSFSLLPLVYTLLGGALAAGGAGVLNQYLEHDLDAAMARTKLRMIPSGRIAPLNALLFGLALLTWSALILLVAVNPLTALLAMVGAVYYVLIYTIVLKRRTALNVIIGGGAGAVPVLVGWAAATGTLSIPALVLFAIIFFWTPPHSWALALHVNSDYAHARIPMMPAVYGEDVTRAQILWYSIHLVLLTVLPVLIQLFGIVYLVAAIALGVRLVQWAYRLFIAKSPMDSFHTYKYTSLYLLLLFLSMILDRLFHLPVSHLF